MTKTFLRWVFIVSYGIVVTFLAYCSWERMNEGIDPLPLVAFGLIFTAIYGSMYTFVMGNKWFSNEN